MEKDNTGDLGITIGMDVSDRFTEIFAIDERGEWVESWRGAAFQDILKWRCCSCDAPEFIDLFYDTRGLLGLPIRV